ncbi:hypothetical protein OSB04_004785 [Centaurea solstitialis]|uniref:Uncharacterized protein n=1 Tax=Centaurea solstitialis TaxID=347529 RepID=A0AA38WP40_9ASTR|nr:hypothetical protein OSB04_004785 [Centaurea solstitialis]
METVGKKLIKVVGKLSGSGECKPARSEKEGAAGTQGRGGGSEVAQAHGDRRRKAWLNGGGTNAVNAGGDDSSYTAVTQGKDAGEGRTTSEREELRRRGKNSGGVHGGGCRRLVAAAGVKEKKIRVFLWFFFVGGSDTTLYRSLAGALQYLTFTRPDIAYAVQQVCLFMHDPRLPHLNALKRILRYLKGTLSHGLHLKVSAVDRLVAYSDVDWAGCPNTRRSTSGFCVYLGDNLVSWSSKRQHVVSRSSAEAEYRGIANVVAETAWLRNLLLELCCPLSRATVVFCDNVSAMYLASNPVQHQRTKHVEIDLHFVRERVAIGHVRVLHVPSAYQYADIFTKGLPASLFLDFRNSLNIRLPPDQTTGVC